MEEQKSGVENFKLKLGLFVLLAVAVGTVLILYYTSEISLKIPIIITGIVFLAFLLVLFSKKLTEKFGKTDKKENPEPLELKKIEDLRDQEIEKLWNHRKIGVPIETKTRDINKNLIYSYKVPLLYEQEFFNEETREWKNYSVCCIILNATYPKIGATVTHGEISDFKLANLMNEKSLNPKDAPDIEETTLSNQMTGTTQTVKKTIQPKEKETQEEEVV